MPGNSECFDSREGVSVPLTPIGSENQTNRVCPQVVSIVA